MKHAVCLEVTYSKIIIVDKCASEEEIVEEAFNEFCREVQLDNYDELEYVMREIEKGGKK